MTSQSGQIRTPKRNGLPDWESIFELVKGPGPQALHVTLFDGTQMTLSAKELCYVLVSWILRSDEREIP